MSASTQRDRVLSALRLAGTHGLTQVDYLLPDVVDGGPPITRLGARVFELIAEGHRISARGRRDKCVIYRLEGGEGPLSVRSTEQIDPVLTTPAGTLFDESVGVPRPLSPYDAEVA
jgi:hypothetical protein